MIRCVYSHFSAIVSEMNVSQWFQSKGSTQHTEDGNKVISLFFLAMADNNFKRSKSSPILCRWMRR